MQKDKYKELYRNIKRRESGLFIIEGKRAIEQAENYKIPIVKKLSTEYQEGFENISSHEIKKITGSKFINEVAIAKYIKPVFFQGPYVLLDHIQDYGNLGSIIRTASAFGIKNIIIFNKEKDFFHHKVYESSRFLVFENIPLYLQDWEDCYDFLKDKQLIITGFGGSFYSRSLKQNDVIIFGNETFGVCPEICKMDPERLTIPTKIHSLNVSNAAAITLFHFYVSK